MREAIRERALGLGFDLCRFTTAAPPQSGPYLQRWLADHRQGTMAYLERNSHKRLNPELVLPAAKSLICLAASYWTGPMDRTDEPAEPGTRGTIARYARSADYHDVLGRKLQELTTFVNELGGQQTKSLWYVDTGPILERDLAQRAGIGFVGKHTNLISRRLGNWFFLSEIITSLELRPDSPETNHCGSCTRCLAACPTGAITAPFELDSRRCISYLTIELKGPIPEPLRSAIGDRIYGCDDCLEACPWNRFAQEGRLMKPHVQTHLNTPVLLELLALDEAAFKEKFRGTPILRSKRRGLLRNVCVALGNVGGPEALAELERAAGDPEQLIAEHARWAIAEIEKRQNLSSNKRPGQRQQPLC